MGTQNRIRNKWYLIPLLISIFSIKPLHGQTGKEFWFVCPEVAQQHSDRPVFLRFSTYSKSADIEITQPANSQFSKITFTVSANSAYSYEVTSILAKLECVTKNSKDNKGLLITSSEPITAYYEISSGLNCDIFALKANNALGTKFTIPFQNTQRANYIAPGIDIVSTEDSNKITIYPGKRLSGYSNTDPISISLNKGETFSVDALSTNASDAPIGTQVLSDKNIAVTLRHESLNGNGGCADLAGDQLIPDNLAGTYFVIMKGYLNSGENYYIHPLYDGTDVKIDGTYKTTLNKGSIYQSTFGSNSVIVIRTSKPIQLFQISGFGCEVGGAIIPPVECTGSKQVSFARSSTDPFYTQILVRTKDTGSFLVNGQPGIIKSSDFSVVPNTNNYYCYARRQWSTNEIASGGSKIITNDSGKFHLGIIHGNSSNTCRFGYFSDFSQTSLAIIKKGPPYCMGDELKITARSTPEAYSYKWTGPGSTLAKDSVLLFKSFSLKDTGLYSVSVSNSACENITEFFNLSVFSDFNGTLTLKDSFNCYKGNKFRFSSEIYENNDSLSYKKWFLNGKDQNAGDSSYLSFSNLDTGNHNVGVLFVSKSGCETMRNYPIVVYPQNSFFISINQSEQCLDGNNFKLSAFDSLNNEAHFEWHWLGQNAIGDSVEIQLDSSSNFYVTTVAENKFYCVDSVQTELKVNPNPTIDKFIYEDSSCYSTQNQTLTLNTSGVKTGSWTLNNGNVQDYVSDTFNVFDLPVGYNKLKLLVENEFGCQYSDSIGITIMPQYRLVLQSDTIQFCGASMNEFQLEVKRSFNDTTSPYWQPYSLNPGTVSWQVQNGQIVPINDTSILWKNLPIGATQVKILNKTPFGCIDSTLAIISIDSLLKSQLSLLLVDSCFNNYDLVIEDKTQSRLNRFAINNQIEVNGMLYSDVVLPPLNNIQSGKNNVYLRFADNFGCQYRDSLTFNLIPPLQISYSIEDGCIYTPLEFKTIGTIPNSTMDSIKISFGDGNRTSNSSGYHTYNQSGNFTNQIIYYSENGCVDTAFKNTTVHPKPKAMFIFEPTEPKFKNDSYKLINNSSGFSSHYWLINQQLYYDQDLSLIAQDTGKVTHTLVVSSEFGCSDTFSRTSTISCNIWYYIPNAFTPNTNGLNDGFRVEGELCNIDHFEFQIFDKYGTCLFQTQDPSEYWYGIDIDGIEVPEGNYVYRVSFQNQISGEYFNNDGWVILLRN